MIPLPFELIVEGFPSGCQIRLPIHAQMWSNAPGAAASKMSLNRSRVLLVYPPSRTQAHETFPLGLLQVAAVLEKEGHEVQVLDANAVRRRLDRVGVLRRVRDWKPDVVGMTLVTPVVREAYLLARELRDLGVKLLAGGPHATLLPEEPVVHGFDGAVIGEGEPTAAEAVAALLGRLRPDEVKGWAFRRPDGEPARTAPRPPVANLDDLPQPARHLVDPLDFGPAENPSLHVNLFTSRGCPARCTYCAGSLFGRRFRYRSPENILNEMDHVHRAYGTRHFYLLDDAMTMNRDRVLSFCEGLLARRLPLTWSVMTRVDAVDEELLRKMAEAGCVKMDFGVESGHPETLRRIRKPHTVAMVRRAIPAAAKAGIKPVVFFILGFPWEGPAEVGVTLNLIRELAPHVNQFHPALASVLIPFPATEIYETYKDAYGFADWWLGTERNFEAPREGVHSYFESRVFHLGAVLDADYFRYSAAVRRKILEVFKFFYLHNIRHLHPAARFGHRTLIEFSQRTAAFSPRFERAVFRQVARAKRLAPKRLLKGRSS